MAAWNPKANDIFLEALEIPAPERRRGYLDDVCADDTALRAQVDSLLLANDGAGSFLQAPVLDPNATTDQPSRPVHDKIIGPYKLLEQIGEGGMGTVFMAEQEHPMRRKVALKLLKPGMDSKQVVARFEAERQALALMDHPNIAHVFDGGTTAAGHPYFVMELVRGIPITAYCDQNRLAVPQRLELFVNVCQAVQHAHQKGIIHRDIKPSNVLVTLHDGTPVVKVIDFGIAKATGQQLTDKTLFTGFAQMIGTPLYMSPEQAGMSGLDVDTRSDIYALGVLLYELLTGTTPFDKQRLREADFDELRRIIREEEPPRPSTRISTLGEGACTVSARQQRDARNLSLLLRGELDWIVMKCLEKDRNRRYETANGLAADVQRYLNDEPVQACPPSASYRLKKFLRRHRGPVLAAALVLLVLVGGIIGTTLGLTRAEHEAWKVRQERDQANAARANEALARKHAEAARDRAADTLDAMTSDDADIALTQQKEITPKQKEFLTTALTFYRELLGEKNNDEATRKRLAAVAGRVAGIEYTLGRKQEALVMSQEALALSAQLAKDFPRVEYRDQLGACHHRLAVLLEESEKRVEAERENRAALALRKQLVKDYPRVPQYRRDLAGSHNTMAILLNHWGKLDRAEIAFGEAISTYRKLFAEFPKDPRVLPYRYYLAQTHHNLGMLMEDMGKSGKARAEYIAATALRQQLVKEYPKNPHYRDELARGRHGLGMVLRRTGKLDEAEIELRAAIGILKKLAGEFLPVPRYRQDLSATVNSLGVLLHQGRGNLNQAEIEYRAAIRLLQELLDEFPGIPEHHSKLAESRLNLANLLHALGKQDQAEMEFQSAIDNLKKAPEFATFQNHRRYLAAIHTNRGRLWREEGKQEQAEKEFHKAIDLEKKLVADFPRVPNHRCNLALSHQELGRLLHGWAKREQAATAFHDAIDLGKKLVAEFPRLPEFRCNLALSHNDLGKLLREAKKWEQAEKEFRDAIDLGDKLVAEFSGVPDFRSNLATSHFDLGILLREGKNRAGAEKEFRAAVAMQTKLVAEFPRIPDYRGDLANSYFDLGILLREWGKRAGAEKEFRAAIAIDTKLVAEFSHVRHYRSNLALSHYNLGILLGEWDKPIPAETEFRAAIVIEGKLVSEFSHVREYRDNLAHSLQQLAVLLHNQGKHEQAKTEIRVAIVLRKQLVAEDPRNGEYHHVLSTCHNLLGNLWAVNKKWAQAETAFRAALDQQKKADTLPHQDDYALSLGVIFLNLGSAVASGGRVKDSLVWYDQAIAILAPLHAKEPKHATVRQSLLGSHVGRAMTFEELKRWNEAVPDRLKALELAPADQKTRHQYHLMISRAHAEQFEPALKDADQLARSDEPEPELLYNCACVYGQAHSRTKDDRHAARAVELLRQAIARGFGDVALLKKDTDLNSIRKRDDFRKLLIGLEKMKKLAPR